MGARWTPNDVGADMTLPPFLTRIQNAAGPLLGGIAESELGARLERTSLTIEIDEAQAADAGHHAGCLLAVNLGARLYPRLNLDAPAGLTAEATTLARRINPGCEFGEAPEGGLVLSWCGGEPTARRVTLTADGWNLSLDGTAPSALPAAPPAAMAVAALGIGELFRALFGDRLAHPRTAPAPLALNLITLGDPRETPATPETVDLGEVYLAGCGAIGEAAVATLKQLPVTGTLYAVDHDRLDEGNLQRYLQSGAEDVGSPKPELIARALADHPLVVEQVATRWGADERTAPGRGTVLSALDSKQGRIELQAGLPRELFNAWTQPQDVGVSRHQAFGTDPCLACLGWPRKPRPSESALIATALGEHELRVVLYFASGVAVGRPLPTAAIRATGRLQLPNSASTWGERSLLQDLIDRYELPHQQFDPLAAMPIRALYHDAVCAGMLIEHAGSERGADVSVPLAHQSALAGILLATWLFVDRVPELRALRPSATQARYDVLRGGAQIWSRSRGREERCLCSDSDFLDGYQQWWPDPADMAG